MRNGGAFPSVASPLHCCSQLFSSLAVHNPAIPLLHKSYLLFHSSANPCASYPCNSIALLPSTALLLAFANQDSSKLPSPWLITACLRFSLACPIYATPQQFISFPFLGLSTLCDSSAVLFSSIPLLPKSMPSLSALCCCFALLHGSFPLLFDSAKRPASLLRRYSVLIQSFARQISFIYASKFQSPQSCILPLVDLWCYVEVLPYRYTFALRQHPI